ncbi:MAG: hypothetical protein ACLGXA_22955 [Acidobacteriota bacterium]
MDQIRRQAQELLYRTRIAGIQFLRVEIDILASTLENAERSGAGDRRARYLANAQKVAHTIRRLIPRLHLSEEEMTDLTDRLADATRKCRDFPVLNCEPQPQA